MPRSKRALKLTNGALTAVILSAGWGSAWAGAIGYLQIDGCVDVQASGSSGPRESYIAIAQAGSGLEEFERVMGTSDGNTLGFEAPSVEGDYVTRNVDGESGAVGSFVYLSIVGDRAAAPWIASNQALVTGVTVAAAGGGSAVLLLGDDDDDDGPTSVSP